MQTNLLHCGIPETKVFGYATLPVRTIANDGLHVGLRTP